MWKVLQFPPKYGTHGTCPLAFETSPRARVSQAIVQYAYGDGQCRYEMQNSMRKPQFHSRLAACTAYCVSEQLHRNSNSMRNGSNYRMHPATHSHRANFSICVIPYNVFELPVSGIFSPLQFVFISNDQEYINQSVQLRIYAGSDRSHGDVFFCLGHES